MTDKLCPLCHSPVLTDDILCSRCRYYQDTFNPPTPIFESKVERAVRAIKIRKMMKGVGKVVNVE